MAEVWSGHRADNGLTGLWWLAVVVLNTIDQPVLFYILLMLDAMTHLA
jgi:hypothetical protein